MTVDAAKRYYEEYWLADEPSPLGDPLAPQRLELVRALVRATGAGRVLDAGCGAGELVAALGREGVDATGIELAAAAVARAPEGARVAEHSVDDLPWPVEPGSQDIVVSFEVIEHLLRPDLLLAGAAEALRPGGRLVLSTPYHGRLKALALALHGFERHFDPVGEHVRFFTDASLRGLVERAGFVVESVRHLGRAPLLWKNVVVVARKP